MFRTLTKFEWILWLSSLATVTIAACWGGQWHTLLTSLLGVTSLLFVAKGMVIGQVLMILFALLYGFISLETAYYGEAITYWAMALPMSVVSMISWIRHPFEAGKSEVAVAPMTKGKAVATALVTILVTVVFYFILGYFNTTNLLVSTLSVTTSFAAASLMFWRSDLYAVGYACNDLVVMTLWVMMSFQDPSYITMVFCFLAFLVNDLYGYYAWRKMRRRQDALRTAPAS